MNHAATAPPRRSTAFNAVQHVAPVAPPIPAWLAEIRSQTETRMGSRREAGPGPEPTPEPEPTPNPPDPLDRLAEAGLTYQGLQTAPDGSRVHVWLDESDPLAALL